MAHPESLNLALERQLAGDLTGAATLYEAILADDPADVPALNLLGLNLLGLGRGEGADPERGIALLREAVLIAGDAVSHLALAQGLALRGRAMEAAVSFRRCLLRDPSIGAAQAGLGRVLRGLGDPAGAEVALRAAVALRPEDVPTHLELSLLLREQGRAVEAALAADAALMLEPGNAEAWSVLGNALLDAGEPAAAIAALTRAVALAPDGPLLHYNLGNALRAAGRESEAVAAFEVAIRLQPVFPEAICNLGAALYLLERFAEAEAAARRTLVLRPGLADAFLNLGNALQAQFRFAEAEAAYRDARRLADDPVREAAACSNLGTALTALERLEEAVAALDDALRLRPDYADAAYNRAVTLLTAGDYANGWPAWEARWRMGWSPPRDLPGPAWRGEPAEGLRIVLHAEQGLGDTLQFARYARLVAARGLSVVLEVQAPLVRLLRAQPGLADVVLARGERLPAFDAHCPLMSLPLALGATLPIPDAPYLAADPVLTALWRDRLAPRPGALQVGLVWAGDERIGHVNSERSIPLAAFGPVLAAAPGARFIALQKDATASDIAASGLALANPMPEVTDFADTAAIIALLDLVISVDTSTAHLAAAMGKAVWLLSRRNGCWRWMTGRADSPWYPSLRIIRQDRPRDWGPAIARIAGELAALAQPAARSGAGNRESVLSSSQ